MMQEQWSSQVDYIGRTVIPAAVRHALDLEPGTALAMSIEHGSLILEPQPERCLFCGATEYLRQVKGRPVCEHDLVKLHQLAAAG